MKLTFNTSEIQKLLQNFYNLTQIPITLFDYNCECVYAYGASQEYCNIIRQNPTLNNYCILSDKTHALEAKEKKKTILFTCHAGITECITPIFYDNIIIAYLMLGKFKDKQQIYSSERFAEETVKKYNLNLEKMLENYEKMPIWEENYINSAIFVLEVCIRYIWSENLIKLNMNMVPQQIEEYILSHLSEKIAIKDLCEKFYMSRQALYQLFETEFNTTIGDFILQKRIQKAINLLETTNMQIYEISNAVGFNDYNYFIRIFKNKTGITPFKHRKKYVSKV